MTSLPRFRRVAAGAAAAALLVSLAACGDDSSDSADDKGSDTPSSSSTEPTDDDTATDATPATPDTTDAPDTTDSSGNEVAEGDLEGALITTSDLPAGYVVSTDDNDDESDTGTCLDDIANLSDTDGFQADVKAKVEFDLDGDTGQNSVSSTLNSYADVADTDAALDLFLQTAQGCTTAQGTDADGVTYDLTLQTDDTVTLTGADRQISVAITGSLASEGQKFPVTFGFVVANIANNLSAVSTSDLGKTEGIVSSTGPIAQTQLDKLAALS